MPTEKRLQPPPAYLLSLKLQGLFSFAADSHLDLSNQGGNPAQWTLILGDNGTGKTTLLRCLAAMEPRAMPHNPHISLLPRIFYEVRPATWFTSERLEHEEWSLELAVTSGLTLRSTAQDDAILGILEYQGDGAAGMNLHGELRQRFEGLMIYGYGATRRMGSTSLGESVFQDHAASLFDDDIPLINAEEWLLQADYAAARSASEREAVSREQRFSRMCEILVSILPDVEEIRIAPAQERRNLPSVEFRTPAGWVPLEGLGLGYRTVVAWIVDMAVRMFDRYPDSEDPLSEPAIVLIDELDLHLHPRWQRQIMSFLSERFPNTQFIATVHSPLVVQAAKDANLVLLRREGDKVVIDNDPAVIENWRIDQILTSVFDLPSARPPELDPLLAERKKLLSKAKLTKADRQKLAELEERIGAIPTAANAADLAAMDIIRRAAAILEGR